MSSDEIISPQCLHQKCYISTYNEERESFQGMTITQKHIILPESSLEMLLRRKTFWNTVLFGIETRTLSENSYKSKSVT